MLNCRSLNAVSGFEWFIENKNFNRWNNQKTAKSRYGHFKY